MSLPSRAFTVAAVCLLALAGCGDSGDDDGSGTSADGGSVDSPLFPDDFKGVCSGATVSAATEYDAGAASHKMLYFETYEDDLQDASSKLPADWTVVFAAEGNALEAIDVVACAERTAEKQVKVCDGYEDDGKDTGNKVRWHTASYEMKAYAATTGEELGSTTVEAASKDCPMFASFEGEGETIDMFDSIPDAQRDEFLRQFAAP